MSRETKRTLMDWIKLASFLLMFVPFVVAWGANNAKIEQARKDIDGIKPNIVQIKNMLERLDERTEHQQKLLEDIRQQVQSLYER